MGLLYPWYVIIIPTYNVNPCFSLKNLGKICVLYRVTWYFSSMQILVPQLLPATMGKANGGLSWTTSTELWQHLGRAEVRPEVDGKGSLGLIRMRRFRNGGGTEARILRQRIQTLGAQTVRRCFPWKNGWVLQEVSAVSSGVI